MIAKCIRLPEFGQERAHKRVNGVSAAARNADGGVRGEGGAELAFRDYIADVTRARWMNSAVVPRSFAEKE